MAGFDEFDPANSCVIGDPQNAWDGPTRMTAWRIFHPVENGRRARWTRKLRQLKSTPCKGDPEQQAICV
jgi:hypothetical protein